MTMWELLVSKSGLLTGTALQRFNAVSTGTQVFNVIKVRLVPYKINLQSEFDINLESTYKIRILE